ncbi:MAG: outer membrane lipoprotein-sorting protein [Phycisphaerae bacterium]|nr:outer membrane lipoprotein-sorting protein [Phycisphaerae bacterium]
MVKILIPVFAVIFFLSGCGPRRREPKPVLGVRKSAAEALSVLRSRSQHTGPLKANGQCVWQYYNDGKKRKENFAVKLWMNPPAEVYLQGDVAFNPRGIVLGSNASEFWLLIKPEVSQYSWGKWAEQDSSSGLMVVPKTLGEALGIVEVVDEKSWSLSQEGGFDVLIRRNDKGGIAGKIYINRRNYLVRKIEYFDVNGKVLAVAELDKYKDVTEDFFVPTVIKIMMYGENGAEDSDSITLNLKSVKPDSFTEKRRKIIFTRPEPKGYEHIYRIIDGHLVEEPQ